MEYIRNTGRLRPPPHWVCVSVNFLIILYHRYLWIFLIYSLYIPYIFPSYVKYVFPYVFLNLWSQEKKSPYRKTTFTFWFRFYTFYIFIKNLWFFYQKLCFFKQNRAHKGPYGPNFVEKVINFDKNHKISNKNIKIVNLEILKVKTWFGDKDLFS